tara:strand:+ start:33911 stop:34696 length:786 start_codon:yes stop_codon:yes gene_type:complete
MNHDFDIAASNYDSVFTYSKIGKTQRSFVHHHLSKILSKTKHINVLEINSGTGEDAKFMVNYNHKITATDISKEMVSVAKLKNPDSNISFEQLDINELSPNTFDQKFDLIFSNFGGLNCLSPEELHNFLKIAPKILSDHGKMVLVVMPKNTLWEQFYFSLKGNLKKAFRRKTKSFQLANVEGILVKTWYYNPKDIRIKATSFKQKKLKPIGLWVPPSYLEHSIVGKKSVLSFFTYLDILFSGRFFSKYADHYYIELEKISS